MKEASGELSMTAVAVVAIAAVGVLFTTLIWPQIKTTITRNTNCSQAFSCVPRKDGSNMSDCKYCSKDDEQCTNPTPIACPTNDTSDKK